MTGGTQRARAKLAQAIQAQPKVPEGWRSDHAVPLMHYLRHERLFRGAVVSMCLRWLVS
jgi:hypothetical protein